MVWTVFLLMWVVVCPVLVYADASANNIGQVDKKKDLAAGHWAIGCIVCGPVGVAWYIAKRRKLIERAKEHPVCLTGGHRLGVMLLIVCLGVNNLHQAHVL